MEQLAEEMKSYRLFLFAVTETKLPGKGDMMLDAKTGYILHFSGKSDGSNVEGLGITLSHHTRAALRHYQAVSAWIQLQSF